MTVVRRLWQHSRPEASQVIPLTALVVDDDEGARFTMAERLRRRGWVAFEADSYNGCGARIGGVCIWSIWEGSGSACDEGGCDAFCTGCGATYGLCQTTQCAGITYGYCACITQY